MKTKRILLACSVLIATAAATWAVIEWRSAHRTVGDSSYQPSLTAALFQGPAPVLLFDEAHRNLHSISGTYEPFALLARRTGLMIRALRTPPTAQTLAEASALMIVTAQGPEDPGDQPAFSSADIAAIRTFVADGGGLVLVVDHFPFADAVQSLARAFGVELSRGMTFDTEHARPEDESQLVFSRSNGLLAAHPITKPASGRGVDSVEVFTGTSMSIPPGATALLATGPNAKDLIPSVSVVEDGRDRRTVVDYRESQPGSGRALAVALLHGRGRVVIVGDSAMLTAQFDRKTSKRFGLTTPGADNELFAAHLLRWVIQRP